MSDLVKVKKKESKPRTEFQRYYDEAISTKYTISYDELSDKDREARLKRQNELHCSSFPYCGLQHTYKILVEGGYKTSFEYSMGNYFLEMGHAVHHFMQKVIGYKGQILGNWACAKCFTLHKNCTYPAKCKKCSNTFFEFEEIGFEYLDFIKGHKDGMFISSKGKRFVIDYKSSFLSAITAHKEKGNRFPYASNAYQIKSYCVMYEDLYKKPVDGWALIYIARDFPNQVAIVEHQLPSSEKDEIRTTLAKWDKDFSVALKFHDKEKATEKRIDFQIKRKLCCDKDFYRTNVQTSYSDCPLAGVCFNSKKLKKEMMLRLSEYLEDE